MLVHLEALMVSKSSTQNVLHSHAVQKPGPFLKRLGDGFYFLSSPIFSKLLFRLSRKEISSWLVL